MFITVQAHQYNEYSDLLRQMFRLRKKVFFDELEWDVTPIGDEERDSYDQLGPVYLIWCDEDKAKLYASMRLMPTTGPTLLFDVFRRTFPDATDLMAPGIWEGTRCCVDVETVARDFPQMDAGRAFSLLCVAAAECALAHGIHSVISNYEPHMKRVYQRAGLAIDELGRADGYGRRPVCCGCFAIDAAIVAQAHQSLHLAAPLYRKPSWSKVNVVSEAA